MLLSVLGIMMSPVCLFVISVCHVCLLDYDGFVMALL